MSEPVRNLGDSFWEYQGERILFDFDEREAYCSKCGEKIKPDPKGKAFQ